MTILEANPAVWLAGGGRVEIRPGDIPSPGAGQALIRTHKTLISAGTELTMLDGRAGTASAWAEFGKFPRMCGYSNVGEVVDVGNPADRAWIGARVASRGSHAAWVIRDIADLRRVPAKVSAEEATFATLAGVAMHGLRRARLTWGESVAVFGLGVVGQLCVRLALVAGAAEIFAVEISDLRRGKVPNRPEIHPLGEGFEAPLHTAREASGGQGVDLVIEATGNGELIPREIGVLRDHGRLLMLSSPRAATTFDFHDLCNRRSLTIIGAHGFSQYSVATPDSPWTRQRHGDLFIAMLAGGRLTVGELITHRFHYERAQDAYALLAAADGTALAVIIDWQ
jgi:2-desacetyl-2-hydroxyethyl bacteriochlorophyllide A dehydrogenase